MPVAKRHIKRRLKLRHSLSYLERLNGHLATFVSPSSRKGRRKP